MADPCATSVKVTLRTDEYTTYCCEDGHVHIQVDTVGFKGNITLETSNDAYTFAEAVMRCFDHIEGIETTKRTVA